MTMRLVVGAVMLALAGAGAGSVAAQVPASTAVDPARLAAARQVVDLAYPPALRSTMFAGVADAMAPMMQRVVEANPDIKRAFDADPRVKPIFDRYMARVRVKTATVIDASIPALFDAYGRAYARRFTLAQLGDLKAFFATPTGALYITRTLSVLSDPDVAAANQAMLSGALGNSRADAQAMADEIKALTPPKPKG